MTCGSRRFWGSVEASNERRKERRKRILNADISLEKRLRPRKRVRTAAEICDLGSGIESSRGEFPPKERKERRKVNRTNRYRGSEIKVHFFTFAQSVGNGEKTRQRKKTKQALRFIFAKGNFVLKALSLALRSSARRRRFSYCVCRKLSRNSHRCVWRRMKKLQKKRFGHYSFAKRKPTGVYLYRRLNGLGVNLEDA